jgi:hypothetical protein
MVAESLAVVVESLVRDLDPEAAVEWTVEPGTVTAALLLDGTMAVAAGVPDHLPVVTAATQIVEILQDAVIEHEGGRAIPPCPVPGHPHPAALRAEPDGPVWRCPTGARPSSPAPA